MELRKMRSGMATGLLLLLLSGGMRPAHAYDGCTVLKGFLSFPGVEFFQGALDELFDGACFTHDVCYSTCVHFIPTLPTQKDTCDLVLLQRLEAWCLADSTQERLAALGISSDDFIPQCIAAMGGAYVAVRSPLGQSAFSNDQLLCHDCVDNWGLWNPITHICIPADPGPFSPGGPTPGNCPDATPETIANCELGGWWEASHCLCLGDGASPILVDLGGDGFFLTGPKDGVRFDINGDKAQETLGWTEEGAKNAFLVLDRNLNGKIDGGLELFGNWTLQPPSEGRNGFLALAEFDRPAMGGNGDGKLTAADLIFSRLQLWIDLDHNGVAGPLELWSLADWKLTAIDLHFERARREDEHGNKFLYRAAVTFGEHRRSFAYDVFLVKGKR